MKKQFFKKFTPYRWQPPVVNLEYVYPENWDDIRDRVLKRDNYTCQECGKTFPENRKYMLCLHHRIPLSRGGSNITSNLVTLCKDCHRLQHEHLQR